MNVELPNVFECTIIVLQYTNAYQNEYFESSTGFFFLSLFTHLLGYCFFLVHMYTYHLVLYKIITRKSPKKVCLHFNLFLIQNNLIAFRFQDTMWTVSKLVPNPVPLPSPVLSSPSPIPHWQKQKYKICARRRRRRGGRRRRRK